MKSFRFILGNYIKPRIFGIHYEKRALLGQIGIKHCLTIYFWKWFKVFYWKKFYSYEKENKQSKSRF